MPTTKGSPAEGEVEAHDLAADTALTRVGGDGASTLYSLHLPSAWNFLAPSGGVLMTIGLRAMRDVLGDPGLRPMAATATFCARVPAGGMRVRVEVLRRGNAAAQLRASVVPDSAIGERGGDGLEVSATFVRDRQGFDFTDCVMPAVTPPEDAAPFYEDAPSERLHIPFPLNFESRLARGAPWWTDRWEPGPARFARWMRYLRPQRLPSGVLDPLALPPVADMMPSALWAKVGQPEPRYHAPSLDLTVHFLDDTTSEWLLLSTYCRRARAGYATAENEIWSVDGRLVAFATQTMIIRRFP